MYTSEVILSAHPQTSALLQSHAYVLWIFVMLMLSTIYFHCHTHHDGLESCEIVIKMKSFITEVTLPQWHKKSYRKHLCMHICEHCGTFTHVCVPFPPCTYVEAIGRLQVSSSITLYTISLR